MAKVTYVIESITNISHLEMFVCRRGQEGALICRYQLKQSDFKANSTTKLTFLGHFEIVGKVKSSEVSS